MQNKKTQTKGTKEEKGKKRGNLAIKGISVYKKKTLPQGSSKPSFRN